MNGSRCPECCKPWNRCVCDARLDAGELAYTERLLGPTGEGDGTSTVAPPVAPARVINATQPGKFPRFFVKSTSRAGVWWRVDFIPGEALTCSCPWGRGIAYGDSLRVRGCRHMRSVCDRMAAEAEAQRVRKERAS